MEASWHLWPSTVALPRWRSIHRNLWLPVFLIIQARRLGEAWERNKKSFAMEIDITVGMDDTLNLQG